MLLKSTWGPDTEKGGDLDHMRAGGRGGGGAQVRRRDTGRRGCVPPGQALLPGSLRTLPSEGVVLAVALAGSLPLG